MFTNLWFNNTEDERAILFTNLCFNNTEGERAILFTNLWFNNTEDERAKYLSLKPIHLALNYKGSFLDEGSTLAIDHPSSLEPRMGIFPLFYLLKVYRCYKLDNDMEFGL